MLIDVHKDNVDAADPTFDLSRSQEKSEPQTAETMCERETANKSSISSLEATIILARRGNKKVLPLLRRALDEHPELWQHFGDLAIQTRETWLQLIAGTDLYLAETLRRHLDEMRAELAGPKPAPLDKLLVERILAAHIQVLYFEAIETTDPTAENMRVARYRMDRRDQAHRHFLAAVKMLATVRNLVARTNTIQVQFLNPPMVHSPAVPIVPVANGDQPMPILNGRVNGDQSINGQTNGSTGPINRINGKLNGHNRLTSLETVPG